MLVAPANAVWTTMAGCPGEGGCNSCVPPGVRVASAASKSWLIMGSPSGRGSQSTGGEAGGEMRNCLYGAGGCKLGFLTGVTG